MTIEELRKNYDWQEVFKYAGASAIKNATSKGYDITDVVEVIATVDGENDGDNWVGLFKMNDGQYLTIQAGCDYTGWGCRESGGSQVALTKEDAIAFGLTKEERTRLGL